MKCPYCLSEVDEEAVACKFCTKDLYLFKPLMKKVDELERQIEEIPNHDAYERRIAELEEMLNERESEIVKDPNVIGLLLKNIGLYLIVPLVLLLMAHALIIVVYDTKEIYLRIVSIIIPLPFGYFLFKTRKRAIFPWFMGVTFLAISSVIGMSGITSLVDKTPVFPQNAFEWREVIQYSASIAFSFLTGMLLGGMAYFAQQSKRRTIPINPLLKAIAAGLTDGKMSPANIEKVMKRLQGFFGTAVALATTAISIYTGLKGIIGS
jgi:hypothetical protein